MRIPFFPTPYPDESISSIVSRHHYWSGNRTIWQTINDLFGRSCNGYISELPNGLDALVSKLGNKGDHPITSDELIAKHTLYPLLNPFITPVAAARFRGWMKSDVGSRPYRQLSLSQSNSVNKYGVIRYCEQCAEENTQEYGEAYWHRSHQVRGVFICHKHETWLVELHERSFSSVLIPAKLSGRSRKANDFEDEQYRKRYIDIAREVYWLLNNHIPSIEHEDLSERYSNIVSRRYFWSEEELYVDDLKKYFGNGLLLRAGCSINNDNAGRWPLKLLSGAHENNDPIKHILLQQFLQFNDGAFWDLIIKKDNYFDVGPWVCRNGFSQHVNQKVVKHCEVRIDPESQRPVGQFICECGYVYEKEGSILHKFYPSSRLVMRPPDEIVKFGRIWEEGMIRSYRESESNTEAISIRDGVDVITIIENLIQNIENDEEIIRLNDKRQYIYFWREWLLESLRTRVMSREGCSMLPQVRKWLSKHDTKWFWETFPDGNYNAKDARDYKLAKLIADKALELRSMPGEPERITKRRIVIAIGKASRCLPKTYHIARRKLSQVGETPDDYLIRRVQYIVNSDICPDDLTADIILKKLGRKKGDLSNKVLREIDSLLTKHNTK